MRVTATLLLWGMCCLGAQASTITYITPPGSTITGQPVDAAVMFTTGPGMVKITLDNLEANPRAVGQNLSDLFFTVGNGNVTSASFGGGSATAISVDSSGMITTNGPLTTAGEIGWVLSEPTSTQVMLDVLSGTGHAGPAHTIIGPPDGLGVYSNANSSIAGNGPHNPFISQEATWTIDAPGVTAGTDITATTFSFGTTAGQDIVGTPVTVVPEASSMLLLGSGVLVFTYVVRRKLL